MATPNALEVGLALVVSAVNAGAACLTGYVAVRTLQKRRNTKNEDKPDDT